MDILKNKDIILREFSNGRLKILNESFKPIVIYKICKHYDIAPIIDISILIRETVIINDHDFFHNH